MPKLLHDKNLIIEEFTDDFTVQYASATIPATTSLALLLHCQMNFYMSKAFGHVKFNDLLIIIYEVTLIQNLSGNCISFHHCFISVCTNPSSKRRLDCAKYTSFIVICWTKCSDMQHLCIALDFSPDLMFFALFFNPTLSQSFYRSANNLLYHTPIGTPSLLTSIS